MPSDMSEADSSEALEDDPEVKALQKKAQELRKQNLAAKGGAAAGGDDEDDEVTRAHTLLVHITYISLMVVASFCRRSRAVTTRRTATWATWPAARTRTRPARRTTWRWAANALAA